MTTKLEILWKQLRRIVKSEMTNTYISLDENEYRLDNLGAIIKKTEYGQKTEYGWTIDHIFPVSKGGDENIENLEAIHWKNNEAKGDSFPIFSYTTSAKKPIESIENESKLRVRLQFSDTVTNNLCKYYPSIRQYYK